ncbi:hypothetical protein ST47_g2214 [Ascochyta rabiei]|uniref:Uncharacterized protein n=1 Tax=Didymella rabiei TaxID=5454 RepID=A0A163JT42_DIDRA|nr:hypothetical protein ST47_g2214 [Ascochyta rabiei]
MLVAPQKQRRAAGQGLIARLPNIANAFNQRFEDAPIRRQVYHKSKSQRLSQVPRTRDFTIFATETTAPNAGGNPRQQQWCTQQRSSRYPKARVWVQLENATDHTHPQALQLQDISLTQPYPANHDEGARTAKDEVNHSSISLPLKAPSCLLCFDEPGGIWLALEFPKDADVWKPSTSTIGRVSDMVSGG